MPSVSDHPKTYFLNGCRIGQHHPRPSCNHPSDHPCAWRLLTLTSAQWPRSSESAAAPDVAHFRIADLYGQSDARFTSNPCSVNDLSARAQIGPYKSF